ncbi:MAG: type IX secretion system membrane protein PorP/SprF [Spirosomataceae bacterium]
MKPSFYYTLLMLLVSCNAQAQQDWLYKTYPFNPQAINPALAYGAKASVLAGYLKDDADYTYTYYLSTQTNVSKHLGVGLQVFSFNNGPNTTGFAYPSDFKTIFGIVSTSYLVAFSAKTQLKIGASFSLTNTNQPININGVTEKNPLTNWGFGAELNWDGWKVGASIPAIQNPTNTTLLYPRPIFLTLDHAFLLDNNFQLDTKLVYAFARYSLLYGGLDVHGMLWYKQRIGVGAWCQNNFSKWVHSTWYWMAQVKPLRSVTVGYSYSKYLPEVFGDIALHQVNLKYDIE